MPIPNKGFWVDRRSLEFVKEIFKCPRESCRPAATFEPDITSSSLGRRLNSGTNGGSGAQDLGGCWEIDAYGGNQGDNSSCSSDALMCLKGNRGPLCSSCDETWTYSSAERVCIECTASHQRAYTVFGLGAGVVVLLISLHFTGLLKKMPDYVRKSSLLGTVREIDPGAFRVLWSNYQVRQCLRAVG